MKKNRCKTFKKPSKKQNKKYNPPTILPENLEDDWSPEGCNRYLYGNKAKEVQSVMEKYFFLPSNFVLADDILFHQDDIICLMNEKNATEGNFDRLKIAVSMFPFLFTGLSKEILEVFVEAIAFRRVPAEMTPEIKGYITIIDRLGLFEKEIKKEKIINNLNKFSKELHNDPEINPVFSSVEEAMSFLKNEML